MRKTAASSQKSVFIFCSMIFITENFFRHSRASFIEQIESFFVDMSPKSAGHTTSSHKAFLVQIAKPQIEFVNVFVDVGIKENRQRITGFFVLFEAGAATTPNVHFSTQQTFVAGCCNERSKIPLFAELLERPFFEDVAAFFAHVEAPMNEIPPLFGNDSKLSFFPVEI